MPIMLLASGGGGGQRKLDAAEELYGAMAGKISAGFVRGKE